MATHPARTPLWPISHRDSLMLSVRQITLVGLATSFAIVACADLATAPRHQPPSTSFSLAEAEPIKEEPLPEKDVGCPPGFTPLPVKVDGEGHTVDHNGDGVGCLFVTPSGHEVYVDNGAANGQLGSCPPDFGFGTVFEAEGKSKDRNANGLVCMKKTPSGQLVFVDDDFEVITK